MQTKLVHVIWNLGFPFGAWNLRFGIYNNLFHFVYNHNLSSVDRHR